MLLVCSCEVLLMWTQLSSKDVPGGLAGVAGGGLSVMDQQRWYP